MPPVIFHGYELVGEWKNSQCGKTAIATKSRKKYFLKQYQTPVAPINNGALDARTFAHCKEFFEKFCQARKKINETIRELAVPGGNIIIPSEEFIEDNHYVEAAEFINGVISEDDLEGLLAGLPLDAKKDLMLNIATALSAIHSRKIIHGDLKLKNVLLVKTETGNYVAKIIDFDTSYFEAEKPEVIIGDINYYSPELGEYANDEENMEELGKNLTTKSDIFSLGLIFHFYLCGELPTPINLNERLRSKQEKGKIIYCWMALLTGGDLQLSSKIKNPVCLSLIRDMLNPEPKDRPTANEVVKRLNEIK